jgi:hypothetical protein
MKNLATVTDLQNANLKKVDQKPSQAATDDHFRG